MSKGALPALTELDLYSDYISAAGWKAFTDALRVCLIGILSNVAEAHALLTGGLEGNPEAEALLTGVLSTYVAGLRARLQQAESAIMRFGTLLQATPSPTTISLLLS